MKRMTMALAVVAGLASAGAARADWGGFTRPPAAVTPAGGTSEVGAPGTLSGLAAEQSHKAPDRFGLLPGLRKVFSLGHKDKDGCADCGGKSGKHRGGCPGGNCGPFGRGGYSDPAAGGYGPGGYGPGAGGPPQMMQGTLVFPHHPFVRSPRDYFMYEGGR